MASRTSKAPTAGNGGALGIVAHGQAINTRAIALTDAAVDQLVAEMVATFGAKFELADDERADTRWFYSTESSLRYPARAFLKAIDRPPGFDIAMVRAIRRLKKGCSS